MWSLKSFRSSKPRPPHPTARRWALEALEDRALLSSVNAAISPRGTTAQAEVAGPVGKGEQVPFRGRLEGNLTTRDPLTSPFVRDTFTITGHASHLGRFKLTIIANLNLTTRTAEGTYLFVAANGDTLTADFTGASRPTDTPGVVLIVETATITGGTGRFADATGSFVVSRLFNTITRVTTGSIEGTISPPGARNR